MSKKYKRKTREVLQIAKESISSLFDEAEKAFNKDKSISNRYIKKARRIAMKYNIRLAPALKRRFCKHCYSFLMPGKNLRIRLQKGRVVYYCLECKKFMRFPH